MAVATKTTLAHLPPLPPFGGNHTAGIYADMTVDGPEIGTLVVVVDRAKNLPNLRTMGKQDPYCAARLAKEAKKTETDKRGGQTPRWDQELRFTVRDSPDYQKLKVSVFNDDKKTDLIGETWISLDHILRAGGGQADDWHRLTIKERYAGEIRMELTYYDSRPKAEKTRSRKQSNASSTQSDQYLHLLHASELMSRKPLPAEPTASAAPLSTSFSFSPDSYPPLPVQHGYQASLRQIPHHESPLNNQAFHGYSGSPLPSLPTRQDDRLYPGERSDHYFAIDDPYVSQAAEQGFDQFPDYYNPQNSLPRHNRVQTLSGGVNSKSVPLYEHSHAYSVRQQSPAEPLASRDLPSESAYREHFSNRTYSDPTWSKTQPDNGQNLSQPPSFYDRNENQHCQVPQNFSEDVPPPPPVHRNSAPPAPRPFPAPPSHQSRTTHFQVPTTIREPDPERFDQRHREPLRNPRASGFHYHLSESADFHVRPRNEMASDPRLRHKHPAPDFHSTSGSQSSPTHAEPAPPSYTNIQNHAPGARPEPLKLIKPIPLHPQRDSASHQTPRKSINSNVSPVESQSSTPYSPDSFDVLNPDHSNRSTPGSGPINKKAPTPMYSSQSSPQNQGNSPVSLQSSQAPSTPVDQGTPSNLPIIGSDGRVKDPTDHLPLSSYAPEPERNQSHPPPVVHVKSRFGPRQARPLSTAAVPAETASQQHKRSPSGTTFPSSPLSPSQSNILNMNNGGFGMSSPYPPPVPGKIPLGGYQDQIGEDDHFEIAALSLENDGPVPPELGVINGKGSSIFNWGRAKKSRQTP